MRLPVILANEAAEHISSPDGTLSSARIEGDRRALRNSLMRTRSVVVRDVAG